ncbi:3-hydroxyisobutyrate dehydrogenase-like beta-hydroxyacid dehydrogenase [Pseudoduganella flava]|uniref:3-hydroxyisobutyrate dehydrogenase-like beta-hydroxyacid dehydrogenase n=2 Tax=Pseudoduganella flava TaxID=871742 RepID=A0A562PVL7_9BURK|nr:NAD(P)-binding domain-containing protein [Pseudoduganella flava]QGZ39567.1 NAD(P)-dependent oxidoreductase [Pseudoduganella flava]TWI48464.1 3-hydroxyisobutyrate dehydrogenase-like beta-hydroxyacid dehydrogenase [Pseudoduganella flava]
MKQVAVIGLGQMGSTLARLLLQADMQVHVWNRSPGRSTPLAAAGAVVAPTPAQAVRDAQVVVMCVHDDAAARSVLAMDGVAAALQGKVLLQLTTVSPQEARAAAGEAHALGAGFLAGAIQVAPEQMGKPDTTILLSGAAADHDRARDVLAAFGGNVVYLGENPGAAATMDLATLSYVYGAAAGFFQGAALAGREGLDVRAYGDIVHAMSPSFGAFLRHEAGSIAAEDYAVSQSPLSISVDATRRIEEAMRERRLHAGLPALIAQLLRDADRAGFGGEEFAAVVKVLRAEPAPS